jgi:hypothetical protein
MICLVLAITMFVSAKASSWDDARGIAMAGSYTAVARGYNSIGYNPANLALPDRPGTAIQLIGIGSGLTNNAFSISDYKKYNGAFLSEADKNDILQKIPAEGLEFRGTSAASVLSFSTGPIAVSASAQASGKGIVSKDVFEIALFGNKLGETIEIDDADAEGVVHLDVNLAYGRRVKTFDWGELTAGINLKYIRGLAYVEVTEALATATTLPEGINGDGSVIVKSALGGSGYGLDLGAAATYGGNWTFSAGLDNLVSSINWNKETRENAYTYELSSLTTETADEDSSVSSDDVERDIAPFSTSLAPQLNLGASHPLGRFLLAADLKLGLANRAGVTTRPEISLGAEYSGLSFLPLRGGIGVGGVRGTSLGLGAGLRLSSFFIDFAWASSGTLLPGIGRGGAVALSSGLSF